MSTGQENPTESSDKDGESGDRGAQIENLVVDDNELKSSSSLSSSAACDKKVESDPPPTPISSSSSAGGLGGGGGEAATVATGMMSSSARKYEISGGGDSIEQDIDDYSEDDTEVSSEAVVDDIELILMPEEVEDLPDRNSAGDHSPKLIRVCELNSEDYEEFFRHEDEVEGEGDGEGDGGEGDNEGDDDLRSRDEGEGEEDEEEDSTRQPDHRGHQHYGGGGGGGKVHSSAQTDISALEKDDDDDGDECFSAENSERFEWRKRKTMALSSGGGIGKHNVKKLNWKSELTLLPSKTKIGFGTSSGAGMGMEGSGGFGSFNYANAGYSGAFSGDPHDQYSSRLATKFTSQDNVMSSSSQFLKPSTLYRTRNLSRNLNHFASSETTFMQDQLDSPRYRVSNTALSSTSSANFKGSTSHSSNQIFATTLTAAKRRPSAKQNFRQSLPDLSPAALLHHHDNNKRRQSQAGGGGRASMKYSQPITSAGYRLQKKSSSDDETSSLISDSERCLRSSIDLLLTEDYPSPGCDYPYLPRSSGGGGVGGGGGGGGQHYAASMTSGYYSARRSCSQPILTDQGFCGEPRDSTMGNPFLPRKLSDMRCSAWAKVILPNGLVAVVLVKEMDEVKDNLTVQTETGCIVTLPFRKVVFAWHSKR